MSPDLVALAIRSGHAATHVVWRGLQGASDRRVMQLAQSEGLVLVTSNGADFLALCQREGIHPGLVIIVPSGISRQRQVMLFQHAVDKLRELSTMLNTVLRVSADGSVLVERYP